MRWPWNAAAIGEKYILGGEDFWLGQVFRHGRARRRNASRRRIKLPVWPLVPVALVCEALARFGIEPVVTRETLEMSRKKMFFSSAKARAELGYAPRPAEQAIHGCGGLVQRA